MKCPVCEVDLQMTERQGVEIDYCSKCRGVWLDRGELDKIIEKSTDADYQAPARPQQEIPRNDYNHNSGYNQPYKKRKSSIIGELFDF